MTQPEPIDPPAPGELPWVLEALLFVAEEPQTLQTLARSAGVSDGAARKALNQLSADYEARGLRLLEDGHRYQLGAAPGYAKYVENMLGTGPGQRLTRAALETLTIIAYKQPCTRGEIEAIRGVNSDRLVAILEQRGLIENTGSADSPGRPRLYRTTMRFLEHFGIRSPRELPPLPDAPAEEMVEAEI
jgi:segregation and condensation protein B